MSIRRRLLFVLVLSGAVLTGAVFAVARLWASGDAARIDATESTLEEVAEGIASELAQRPSEPGEARRHLERTLRAVLSGARRATAGTCEEPIVAFRAKGREGTRTAAMPADHAAAIAEACAAADGETLHRRVRVRQDTLLIAVARSGAAKAWAAMPIRTREGLPMPFKIGGAALGLATIALVLVALDAMFALRRGAEELEGSFEALGADLNAEVATPRAEELARIASGLRRMAARLSESSARERALSERLAHEERLAALGRVAAGVAHEVRNPLAGMKLQLDLMKRAPELAPELREDVETCLQEIERLDRLVRTILGAARRDPAIREGVALGALVDERIASFGDRVERVGDATIATDPDLLVQIVDNLVRNAVEASPAGEKVRVEIEKTGGGVELVVVDRGPGIPEAHSAEMFEPFFTTKGEGTGLGLFISRSLARALKGTLDYARSDGSTRFRLQLPS